MSEITWHIRVSFVREGYEDYPCFSFYDIKAYTHCDAELEARKQFCESFGFKMEHTKAFTFNTTDYYKYNREKPY